MRVLVTGGCGFIGSALVRLLVKGHGYAVCNLDKLTYSGDQESVEQVAQDPNYEFVHGDICDAQRVSQLLQRFKPDVIVHTAAETHVDRSIGGPGVFIETNILGTFNLLEQGVAYWTSLPEDRRNRFRFLHVSTDEVFGELGDEGKFTETNAYQPNSPYSASKAASDHLVRAWHRTYDFPTLTTNCSNNYGPYQFPEKLIPLMILRALAGKSMPVYGDGKQIRDWLHVEDHARALHAVLQKGRVGETYNIGGNSERRNIDLVREICSTLAEKLQKPSGHYERLIEFVTDRPGHDFRYAIDTQKITQELDWSPDFTFSTGLENTVEWYLSNEQWMSRLAQKSEQGA